MLKITKDEILDQRTISSFPISIGTALALETLFDPVEEPYDPDREIPDRVELTDYDVFMINFYTLYRNLLGSLPHKLKENLKGLETLLVSILFDEILYIKQLLEMNEINIPLLIYLPNYTHIEKLENEWIRIRRANTPKQLYFKELEDTTMDIIRNNKSNLPYPVYFSTRSTPKQLYKDSKVLILTHIPYDLLSRPRYKQLDLLESHTGKLKPYYEWYTKLIHLSNKPMYTLPFNKYSLYIFGDNIMFRPMELAFRKEVLNIALNRNFTPHTTEDKFLFYLQLDCPKPYKSKLHLLYR